ncbi:DUF7845 domain-containing protein [Halococcus hamelinensis]|uniref:DUF7845 domain-containing protein n=1 Tax=Halococcus hamelinensis 100A6 TaxID=1132509 RepID=M0M5V6_9EURY|nr:hypothetical protein [Halococcus hamelinensis]EMA41071.1 hypothetical protein C447_02702 [Halococcus hamelinensis 100A6]
MSTSAPESVGVSERKRGFFLDPAPHEAGANLLFTEYELQPFYVLYSVVDRGSGTDSVSFQYDDEEWTATLGYSDCPFAPRDDPNFRIENVHEYELHVVSNEDPLNGEKKVHYNISPRWPDMRKEDGSQIRGMPDMTGINVTAQGANIPLDDYLGLLGPTLSALGINAKYVVEPHDYSNVFAFERYVRTRRDLAESIFGTDSPMQRIFRYVDGKGKFRELREDDRNGVEGFHHRVVLDSAACASLIPTHQYGKCIKHYHPKHPRHDSEDPLYHPKIGVSIKTTSTTSGSVPWAERATLRRELDETLLNLLSWAGLPTRPVGETYIEDAYFDPDDSVSSLMLIEDPTTAMRDEQFVEARRILLGDPTADDPSANDTEQAALRALTNDGKQDVTALAETIGRSRSTVYRLLDALGEVVTNNNGTIGFASEFYADQFTGLLSTASTTIQKDGERGSSAWSAYLAEYGPAVDDLLPDARDGISPITLDYGTVNDDADMKAVVRKGLRAWLRSGRKRRRFVNGIARWIQNGEAGQVGTASHGKMDLPLTAAGQVTALS